MGSAFLKGGCGCLLMFLMIGFVAILIGGRFHVDLGGLIFLFLIGGGFGLFVRWIFLKGQRNAFLLEKRDKTSIPPPLYFPNDNDNGEIRQQ